MRLSQTGELLTLKNKAPFGTLITPGVVPIMLHTLLCLCKLSRQIFGDFAKNGGLWWPFWTIYSYQILKKKFPCVDYPLRADNVKKIGVL